MLEVGLNKTVESKVTEQLTAKALKSGSLNVYATPAMICLMEQAAAELADENLPTEQTSVGISMNIKHISPTPVGQKIKAIATISEIEGRKICFTVKAFDEVDEIGNGVHERFIVNRDKFQSKADSKNI